MLATSAVLVSNATDQHLIEWLRCAGGPNEQLHNFTTPKVYPRKAWREPPINKLCCFPRHGNCFRAVLDAAVRLPELPSSIDRHPNCRQWAAPREREIVSAMGVEFHRESECTTNPLFMLEACAQSCRKEGFDNPGTHLQDTHLDKQTQDDLSLQIQRILEREFEVEPVTISTARSKTYMGTATVINPWSELHADYYESENFVFSAVLFLGVEQVAAECMQ